MIIYSIAITVIAIIVIAKCCKWKIAARAITFFCMDKFREPTQEEITKYTQLAIKKSFQKGRKDD